MFYSFVRLAICVIVFAICFIIIKKSNCKKKRRAYIISIIFVLLFGCVISFIPFENIFGFSSLESAYYYYNTSPIKLIVHGSTTDCVLSDDMSGEQMSILPKSDDKWKIHMGWDTKLIALENHDNVSVMIVRYKESRDFYIYVTSADPGPISLSDNRNSEFVSLTKHYSSMGETYYDYYAYIENLDSGYKLLVNGNNFEIITNGLM